MKIASLTLRGINLSSLHRTFAFSRSGLWPVFQRFMIPYWKHQDLGRRQRRVPEVNQSVNIQLPSAEDGEGFLWNIRISKRECCWTVLKFLWYCVFTFASEFRQNNARSLRFWCVKCTNPEGECIEQASKLKRKCIILSKFSMTK